MNTIHKYLINSIDTKQVIEMPLYAIPLFVDTDHEGNMCIWLEVDTDHDKEGRELHVVDTGQESPESDLADLEYVGTIKKKPHFWHIYLEEGI